MRKLLLMLLLLVPLDLYAQGGAGGTAQTGGGSGAGSAAAGGGLDKTINPLSAPYNAKFDVQFFGDCTFTNLSQTVTCPEAPFTAADVGKIEFGTVGTTQINSSLLAGSGLVVPQGTITGFTNATTVTVSIAATQTCTTSNSIACTFAYGTQDDTTAINAAMAAAWNVAGAPCSLQLPAGRAFISAAILNGPVINTCMGSSTNGTLADMSSTGPVVYGQGPGSTVLIPLPTFNFATCTFGTGSATCIGGLGNLFARDFAINGLQQSLSGVPHAVNLFELVGVSTGGGCDGGVTGLNLAFSGWALLSTNSTGFLAGNQMCNDSTLININVSAFGQTPCHIAPANTLNAYGLFCFGANNYVLELDGTASGGPTTKVFNSFGGQYLGTMANQRAAIHCFASGTGLTMNSWGEYIGQGNSVPAQTSGVICNGQSAIFNFSHDTFLIPSGTTGASQLFFLNGGNTVHVDHSVMTATGTNNHILTTSATDGFFDDGWNTFTNGTVANSIAANTYFGAGSSTGVAITAAKLVLSAGWGASAAWTALSGATRRIQGTITNTGAGQAANPTITYTFPTPFMDVSNVVCEAHQVGGTQAILAATEFLTPSALSTVSVVFTYNGTPTVNLTEVVQASCDSL